MLIIATLIQMLIITKVCQSLTIYPPNYLNYNGSSGFGNKVEDEIKQSSLPHINPSHGNDLSTQYFKAATLSPTIPYQAGSISNVLSQTTLMEHKQPGYSNIYPVQYQYKQSLLATRPKQQPVTAASLESEILRTSSNNPKLTHGKLTSNVNYNNKIYHININNTNNKNHNNNNNNKRASPLLNNEQQKNPKNIVRKQRNLKENHDDKLIEQNNNNNNNNNNKKKEIRDVNDVSDDQQYSASDLTSSIKQPSSSPSTMTSHEIRYLHDIFLNYPKSHHANAGHIELSPVLFEKRFESQKGGNRYKGEVMWLDNTGGFAQHYWDLAQGKL